MINLVLNALTVDTFPHFQATVDTIAMLANKNESFVLKLDDGLLASKKKKEIEVFQKTKTIQQATVLQNSDDCMNNVSRWQIR